MAIQKKYFNLLLNNISSTTDIHWPNANEFDVLANPMVQGIVMIKFFRKSCLLLLLILLCSPTMLALATDDHFQRGKTLFDGKQHEEAYQELYLAFLNDPADLDLNFYLGRAAFESGRFEEAAMAYERVLMVDPQATRVKLELARAYLGLGSRELAKQYFREVLDTNPPEQVWKNIESFLAAIEQSEKRHFINGIFSLGFAADDNANVAPDNKIVEILVNGVNLPVTIDQDPVNDVITSTTLVLNHLYKNEELPIAWKTTATNYNAFYASQAVNDINLLNLSSGPVWQSEHSLCQLYGQATYADVGHDRYLGAVGLGANFTWLFNQGLAFSVTALTQQKKYYQDNAKDGTGLIVSAGPIFTFGANRISISGATETENADASMESYNRYSVSGRYDRRLPYDFSTYASIRWQDTDYDGVNPLFGVTRSDTTLDYSVGLSRLLWMSATKQKNLSALLYYTYTEADSNIATYDYSKNLIATTFTLAF